MPAARSLLNGAAFVLFPTYIMRAFYPLRFTPMFRRALWGGRRLQTHLDKALDEGGDFAESWEIVDHNLAQSFVECGPLQGAPLGGLTTDYGMELFGEKTLDLLGEQSRFPLLFKFLDAHRPLSVQVHPDDFLAARQDPPDLGKTEAWVVQIGRAHV